MGAKKVTGFFLESHWLDGRDAPPPRWASGAEGAEFLGLFLLHKSKKWPTSGLFDTPPPGEVLKRGMVMMLPLDTDEISVSLVKSKPIPAEAGTWGG